MEAKKTQKAVSHGRPPEFDKVQAPRDDVEKDDRAQEICLTSLGKRVGQGSGWQDSGKKAKGEGSMDLFMIPKWGQKIKLRQININDACKKETRARTTQ